MRGDMVKKTDEFAHGSYDKLPFHWYVVCAIVAGCVTFLVGVSVCVYRCYRRRSDRQSPDSRLSSAIRKGLMREYHGGSNTADEPGGLMTKSPSMRSTGSSHSAGSSTGKLTMRDPPSSLPQGTRSVTSQGPGGVSCAGGEGSEKARYYTTNERQNSMSPQEKGESSKEKAAENEGKGAAAPLGSLFFTVAYDGEKSALIVAVTRASDLPIKDQNVGSSDPYVKLQLLPDKRQKVKTRVLRKTLNPVFDEAFTFYSIDVNQLAGITLHFVVLSYDRFSRDDIIGEVIYSLSENEFGKLPIPVCKEIAPRHIKMCNQSRGELLVSVCHHPAANRLTVVVLKARNLPKMDITGLSDPYVKVYLRYNGQRIAKKKTHVKKRTLNPVFNESFLFDLPQGEALVGDVLSNISLELYVLDWDQMTKNEVIGRLEIGKLDIGGKFGEQETRHWNEVMNCPRKQIAGWHKLVE